MDVFFRGIFVSQPVGEAKLDGWYEPTVPSTIIHESEILFSSLGYTKTTVDEIARNAGVSKRTLYERFPKKSDIAIMSLLHGARELRATADSLTFQDPTTFQDQLLTLTAAFVNWKSRLSERFFYGHLICTPGRAQKGDGLEEEVPKDGTNKSSRTWPDIRCSEVRHQHCVNSSGAHNSNSEPTYSRGTKVIERR